MAFFFLMNDKQGCKLVLGKKVPIGPLNLKRKSKPKKLGLKWTILKGNLHP